MTAATDPAGPTGRLATWLADLSLDDVPPRAVERAKALTLDGLACAIVGAQLPWSRRAVDLVTRLEGTGTCGLVHRFRGTDQLYRIPKGATHVVGVGVPTSITVCQDGGTSADNRNLNRSN